MSQKMGREVLLAGRQRMWGCDPVLLLTLCQLSLGSTLCLPLQVLQVDLTHRGAQCCQGFEISPLHR